MLWYTIGPGPQGLSIWGGMFLIRFSFLLWMGLAFAGDAIVENGLKPKGQSRTMVFEEDLRFGGVGSDSWNNANTNIAVAADGTIYVADTLGPRVLAYDGNGKLIREVIGPGKGDGQLEYLDNIAVLADGRLAVLEALSGVPARIHFIDAQGNYQREHVPANSTIVRSCLFDPKGKYLAGSWITAASPTQTLTTTGLMDLDLQPVQTVQERIEDMDPTKVQEPDYFLGLMVRLLEGAYAAKTRLAYDSDGRLFYARSDQYKVSSHNGDMSKTHWTAKKAYNPIANDNTSIANTALPLIESFKEIPAFARMITPEFVGKMLENAQLPTKKNPIYGLIPTGDGGVLVIHDFNLESGDQLAHVFDGKGHFVGEARMDNQAFLNGTEEPNMIFANGYAYSLERTTDRINSVVRYRYSLK